MNRSQSSSNSQIQKDKGRTTKVDRSRSQSSQKSIKRIEKRDASSEIPRIERMAYVSHLDSRVNCKELEVKVRQLFERSCTVKQVSVRSSVSGAYSYAFVEIIQAEKLKQIIQEFDGAEIDGRKIVVEKKKSNPLERRRGSSPPRVSSSGCYRCGKTGHFARECNGRDREPERMRSEVKHKKEKKRKRQSSSESEDRKKSKKHGRKYTRSRHKKDHKRKKVVSESSSYSSSSSSSSSDSSSSSEAYYRRKKKEQKRKARKGANKKKDRKKRRSSSSSSV